MYIFINYTKTARCIDGTKNTSQVKHRNIFAARRFMKVLGQQVRDQNNIISTTINFFRVFDDEYKLIFESKSLNDIEIYLENEYQCIIKKSREIYCLKAFGCDANTTYNNHTQKVNFSDFMTLLDMKELFDSKDQEPWESIKEGLHTDFDITVGISHFSYGEEREFKSKEKFLEDMSFMFGFINSNPDKFK